MMLENLFIHIGTHKAGSTSLQYALSRQNIVCYPKSPNPPFHNHNWFVKEPAIEDLVVLLKDDNKTGVVSSAHYSYYTPHQLKLALEVFKPIARNITVVCFIRPIADYVKSSYAEKVKIGDVQDSIDVYFDNFLDTRYYMMGSKITSYRQQFGDTIKFLPAVDVTNTFFKLVGLPHVDAPVANKAMCVQDLALLKMFHQYHSKTYNDRRSDSWIIPSILSSFPVANPIEFKLHRLLVEQIHQHYYQDACVLDVELGLTFFENELTKSLEAAPESIISLEFYKYYTDDVKRIVAAWAQYHNDTYLGK